MAAIGCCGMRPELDVTRSGEHLEHSSEAMNPRTFIIPMMSPDVSDLEILFSNDLISTEIVTHCDVLTCGRVRRVSKACASMMKRVGGSRLRFYGCREWLKVNYEDFCPEATSDLAHEMPRGESEYGGLGSPPEVRAAIDEMRACWHWRALAGRPQTQAIAFEFIDWDHMVVYAHDEEEALGYAEANSVSWAEDRATAYDIATSMVPGALKGEMKGYARKFGRDWGVTGQECVKARLPNIHAVDIGHRAKPNVLEVMVYGGDEPPCQQVFGVMDCKCRSYTVGVTTTMLALKFLIQARTSQPAHSFWLLKADGSIVTGGLAMQNRLIDQGVHSGSGLYIATKDEDTPRTVHTRAHKEVQPRADWRRRRDEYRRQRKTHNVRRSKGQPAREWARSLGNIDMMLEWGDTGRDGLACTRVDILVHRHQVGF